MRQVAIPFLVRRADGLIARVIESDGVTEQGRWVGPFADADEVRLWLEVLANEALEVVTPAALGLPAELAVLREASRQADACRRERGA